MTASLLPLPGKQSRPVRREPVLAVAAPTATAPAAHDPGRPVRPSDFLHEGRFTKRAIFRY
ncbi:MAG: hypothetical protein WCI65_13130, partial [Synechococcaceae cyanobacterium ELA263]